MTLSSKTAFSRSQANGAAVAWLEFIALAALVAILATQFDASAMLAGLERWVNSMGHPYNHMAGNY